jgi:hypothetical protein
LGDQLREGDIRNGYHVFHLAPEDSELVVDAHHHFIRSYVDFFVYGVGLVVVFKFFCKFILKVSQNNSFLSIEQYLIQIRILTDFNCFSLKLVSLGVLSRLGWNLERLIITEAIIVNYRITVVISILVPIINILFNVHIV